MVDTNKDDKLDSEIAKRLDDLFGEGDASSVEPAAMKAEDATADENKSQNQLEPSAGDEIFELADVATNKPSEGQLPADYPLAELKNMVLSIDWEITDEVLSGFLSQIDRLKSSYKNEKIILMFLQLLGSLGEYVKTNRGNAHPQTFKILNSAFSSLEEVLQKDETNIRVPITQKVDKPSDRVPAPTKSYDSLAEAIEELKQFIHSELSALRQELKNFHKSK